MNQEDKIKNRLLNITDYKDNEFCVSAVNSSSVFKITLNFTDYINHNIIITAKKFSFDGKSYIDSKKVYSAKYEVQELKQLSPYFKILNTIFDIFKKIIFMFNENSVELFDIINGVTLILTFSNFDGLILKIPFLLLPKIENEKNNGKNEKIITENNKISDNNIEEMIGKKRTRKICESIDKAPNKIEKTK